jgi:hypothetical protein
MLLNKQVGEVGVRCGRTDNHRLSYRGGHGDRFAGELDRAWDEENIRVLNRPVGYLRDTKSYCFLVLGHQRAVGEQLLEFDFQAGVIWKRNLMKRVILLALLLATVVPASASEAVTVKRIVACKARADADGIANFVATKEHASFAGFVLDLLLGGNCDLIDKGTKVIFSNHDVGEMIHVTLPKGTKDYYVGCDQISGDLCPPLK